MMDLINKIIKENLKLKAKIDISKIDAGFNNQVYNINNLYIVKICSNNKENFKKEISFYLNNYHNNFIPQLYYFNIEEVPFYAIIQKVEGISLYHLWHTFSESQREKIIKQLCQFMKLIHKEVKAPYDWNSYVKQEFQEKYQKVVQSNIFSSQENRIINAAYNKFDKYFKDEKLFRIHNDLHFDNIIYDGNNIKVIDFERTICAPKDFELNIIDQMIKKPWKYASASTEKYTNIDDYKNIAYYIKKYYPEIVSHPFFKQRLTIYNILYCLRDLVREPNDQKNKKEFMDYILTIYND